jgi:sugar-specific transcriptional regulator TrmB
MDELLADLGLTTLEIKIYKLLIHQGPNSAGNISSKTGIHRRNAYDALERLIQKGLVSYIKENNIKTYSANEPEIVLQKLRSREREWEELIPELKKHIQQWNQKKETLFFRGINGIKNIFMDHIEVGEEILVNATTADVQRVVKYFMPKYQQLRKEKKIPTRMMFDEEAKKIKENTTIQELPLAKIKYIHNFNSSNSSEYIYGNNVAYVLWNEEEPFAILIRHKEIADAKKQQFELLWKFNK